MSTRRAEPVYISKVSTSITLFAILYDIELTNSLSTGSNYLYRR